MKQGRAKQAEHATSTVQVHELTLQTLMRRLAARASKSVHLAVACCTGKHIPDVTIELW
jgi:hypothetical protein